MLYAEKANKVLKIDESEQDAMIKMGFDITSVDDHGVKTLIAIGLGKTVPAQDLAAAKAKIESLEAEVESLKKELKKAGKKAEEAAANEQKEATEPAKEAK